MKTVSIRFSEYTYPSADGKHTVHAEIYEPTDTPIRGVVQLAHGMIDHVGRYTNLANALCAKGFVLAGNCHLGHGKTAGREDDFGFFAEKDGVKLVLKDLHAMNRYLRTAYPNLPIVLMGHSMGSFLARLYIEKYPHGISGLIIHGTGGPNPLLGVGKALAATIRYFRGERYRSSVIANMAFVGYNSKFPPEEGVHAWLTRDQSCLSAYADDPYTNFIFTVSGYQDLFRMVGDCNSKAWFENFPKDLPTLIVSGTMDPVGNFGKGPQYVYGHLLIAGCTDVTVRLYDGARHELFNETNREEIFADMIGWLENIAE